MNIDSKIQGKAVLVVDDNDQIHRLVRQILQGSGASSMIFASNGQEALGQLRKRAFDLIIADWLMPGMDGLTFVGKLRGEKTKPYSRLPVIMLTGRSSLNDVKTAVAAGINGYVVKPCSPKALLSQIDKVLA